MSLEHLPLGPSQSLEVFRDLPSTDVERLLEGAELLRHRHRDLLFRAGEDADHFALVVSGCYKLLKPSPKGVETLLAFATASEPIGLLTMAPAQARYPVTAQSLGASSLFWIPRGTYLKSWLQEPEIVRRMHQKIMDRCRGFHSDRSLQHLPLPARVAGFLLRCLDLHGVERNNLLRYPLTRREISEAVGAQPESVIRVMSAWQKSGWLTTCERHIEILHPEKLAEFLNRSAEE